MDGDQQCELRVSSLGSGSNGNAFLVEFLGTRILLDAGIPIRTLVNCLANLQITASDLSAILISHEHSDHIRALAQLLRRRQLPVFATRGTHAGLEGVPDELRQTVSALDRFDIGSLRITPIPVSHDSREPVGFAFESEVATATILTDVGEVSEINAEFASQSDHLVIESNYDELLLRNGPYPAYLKRRIRSAGGHLSNEECASFLRDVVNQRTRSIWLCHLSENNNQPEVALAASAGMLKQHGKVRDLIALPRYDGTVRTWRSSDRPQFIEQTSLGF